MKSARSLYISTLIALLPLLASCSSTTRVVATLEEPDQALMQACPPAPTFDPQKPLLLGDLVAGDVELAGMYHECRAKQSGLAKYVRTLLQRVKAAPGK